MNSRAVSSVLVPAQNPPQYLRSFFLRYTVFAISIFYYTGKPSLLQSSVFTIPSLALPRFSHRHTFDDSFISFLLFY